MKSSAACNELADARSSRDVAARKKKDVPVVAGVPLFPTNTLANRLRWLQAYFGGQRPCARRLGTSKSAIDNLADRLDNGGSGLQRTFDKFYRNGVSREWLFDGVGQPFDTMPPLHVAALQESVSPPVLAAASEVAKVRNLSVDDWRELFKRLETVVGPYWGTPDPMATTVRRRG